MHIEDSFRNLALIFVLIISNVLSNNVSFVTAENYSTIQDNILIEETFQDIFAGDGLLMNSARALKFHGDFSEFQLQAEQELSNRCQKDMALYTDGVDAHDFWAMKMQDSSAKIPAGVLYGNLRWLGSYDECLEVEFDRALKNEAGTLQGQYCHFGLRTEPFISKFISGVLKRLVVGVCIPDSCNETDFEFLVNNFVRRKTAMILPRNISLLATHVTCQEKEIPFSTKAIFMLAFCGAYVTFMLIASAYEIYLNWNSNKSEYDSDMTYCNNFKGEGNENGIAETQISEKSPLPQNGIHKQPPKRIPKQGLCSQLLLCFSIIGNVKRLLRTTESEGSFPVLHGIRFFSICWVVIGHSFLYSSKTSNNILVTFPVFKKRISAAPIVNATVSVDSFFALSGFLVAYILLTELKKRNGKINWPVFYFHRFWRLTPSYMIFLMIYAVLNKYVYNGPLWPKDGFEYNECEGSWWRNILYINNFAEDPKDKCMYWSWYLANDMQFYLISPLLILPLYYWVYKGFFLIGVVLLGSWIASGVIARHYDLPIVYGFKPRDESQPSPWTLYYEKPYCRIGPYLMGIITGYILYKLDCRAKLNKYVNLLCWAVATALACVILYGIHDPLNGMELSPDAVALYITTHRTLWGACICWVIFACTTGNAGFINTILSWKVLVPFSRLTFFVYLINPIVELIYLNGLRDSIYQLDLELVYHLIASLTMCFMLASVLSISLESPLLAVEKVLLKRVAGKK